MLVFPNTLDTKFDTIITYSNKVSAPSSKILLTVVASIIAIGGIWYVTQTKYANITNPSIKSTDSSNETLKALDTGSLSNKDSDNDGLPDWEETIWGLNPNDPYSNGHKNASGTQMTDNEYVKAQPSTSTINPRVDANNDSVTQTGKIGQEIFDKYLALKQQGIPIDNATKEKLIQEAIKDNPYPGGKIYITSDIKIGGTETTNTLRVYGDNLVDIATKNSPVNSQQTERDIILNAVQTKNLDNIKNLDPFIKSYHNILTDLLNIKVTQGVSDRHLTLINSISAMLYDIESVRAMNDDPARGIKGVKSYLKTSFDYYWALGH